MRRNGSRRSCESVDSKVLGNWRRTGKEQTARITSGVDFPRSGVEKVMDKIRSSTTISSIVQGLIAKKRIHGGFSSFTKRRFFVHASPKDWCRWFVWGDNLLIQVPSPFYSSRLRDMKNPIDRTDHYFYRRIRMCMIKVWKRPETWCADS